MKQTGNRIYKVIVWATGGIGKSAIRTISDRDNLELVGVWVHSESKDGKDAGELAEMDRELGVRATRDAEALLALDADCVVYVAPAASRPHEARSDWCRILASGKSIVTTALPGLVYERGSVSERFLAPLKEACEAGKSAIYSTGIEPGFGCDLFPIALLTMSHKVFKVRGLEIHDYSHYPVAWDMRELFCFGQPLDYQGGLRRPGSIIAGWGAAVTMVAEALGVELDEIRESTEVLPTPVDIRSASGLVQAGTIGAIWAKCIGIVDGEEVVTIEHVNRMSPDMAPEWPKSRTGGTSDTWRVQIEGEPSFDAEFEVGFDADTTVHDHGLLATGMRAVNAIPWVSESVGIVDALHLPLTPARGALHPKRDGISAWA